MADDDDDDYEARLNVSLDQYVATYVRELVAKLGESPEAVRGAVTLTSLLATVTDQGVDAGADTVILLTTMLAILNKVGEVLGGE